MRGNILKKVYVVTGRPATVDRWKLLKSFVTEELAEKYIKEEEAKDKSLRVDTETEGIEYYDIDELDLVTD